MRGSKLTSISLLVFYWPVEFLFLPFEASPLNTHTHTRRHTHTHIATAQRVHIYTLPCNHKHAHTHPLTQSWMLTHARTHPPIHTYQDTHARLHKNTHTIIHTKRNNSSFLRTNYGRLCVELIRSAVLQRDKKIFSPLHKRLNFPMPCYIVRVLFLSVLTIAH